MTEQWEGSKEQAAFISGEFDAVLDVLIEANMWTGAPPYRGKSAAEQVQMLVDRAVAAEAALAAVPVEAIRRYYLHSWSAPAEDYDDATLDSDENAFVDWLNAAPQQEVQP